MLKRCETMPYGMYIAAAGAHAQSQRLQVLTNNLANADTPGFKRELAVFQARHAEAIERGLESPGSGGMNDIGGGVFLAETLTDFSHGTLRQTGNRTDFAIDGDGFFLVEKEGQQLLTRAGNFQLSNAGELQTEEGHSVLSAGGEPVTIDRSLGWDFLENGSISQEGTVIPIALVRPRSNGDLVKAGQNLFSALADVIPVANADRRMRHGFLEQSSIKPATEMMELIETSRAYEANVRMIQNQDHMIGTLVNRVLRQ